MADTQATWSALRSELVTVYGATTAALELLDGRVDPPTALDAVADADFQVDRLLASDADDPDVRAVLHALASRWREALRSREVRRVVDVAEDPTRFRLRLGDRDAAVSEVIDVEVPAFVWRDCVRSGAATIERSAAHRSRPVVAFADRLRERDAEPGVERLARDVADVMDIATTVRSSDLFRNRAAEIASLADALADHADHPGAAGALDALRLCIAQEAGGTLLDHAWWKTYRQIGPTAAFDEARGYATLVDDGPPLRCGLLLPAGTDGALQAVVRARIRAADIATSDPLHQLVADGKQLIGSRGAKSRHRDAVKKAARLAADFLSKACLAASDDEIRRMTTARAEVVQRCGRQLARAFTACTRAGDGAAAAQVDALWAHLVAPHAGCDALFPQRLLIPRHRADALAPGWRPGAYVVDLPDGHLAVADLDEPYREGDRGPVCDLAGAPPEAEVLEAIRRDLERLDGTLGRERTQPAAALWSSTDLAAGANGTRTRRNALLDAYRRSWEQARSDDTALLDCLIWATHLQRVEVLAGAEAPGSARRSSLARASGVPADALEPLLGHTVHSDGALRFALPSADPDAPALDVEIVPTEPPWCALLLDWSQLATDADLAERLAVAAFGPAEPAEALLRSVDADESALLDGVEQALNDAHFAGALRALHVSSALAPDDADPEPGQVLEVEDWRRREAVPFNHREVDGPGIRVGDRVIRPSRVVRGPALGDGFLELAHRGFLGDNRLAEPSMANALDAAWKAAGRPRLAGTPIHNGAVVNAAAPALRILRDSHDGEVQRLVTTHLTEERGWRLVTWDQAAEADGSDLTPELYWSDDPEADCPTRYPGFEHRGGDGEWTTVLPPLLARAARVAKPRAFALAETLYRVLGDPPDTAPSEVTAALKLARRILDKMVAADHVPAGQRRRHAQQHGRLVLLAIVASRASATAGHLKLAAGIASILKRHAKGVSRGAGFDILTTSPIPDRRAAEALRRVSANRHANGGWWLVTEPGRKPLLARGCRKSARLLIPGIQFRDRATYDRRFEDQPPAVLLPRKVMDTPPWAEELEAAAEEFATQVAAFDPPSALRVRRHLDDRFASGLGGAFVEQALFETIDLIDEVERASPAARQPARRVAPRLVALLERCTGWREVPILVGKPAPRGLWDRKTSRNVGSTPSPVVARVLSRAFQGPHGKHRPARIEGES